MMSVKNACVFCQIVSDGSRCELLAEDAETMAFMDIHPANEGHCLVIPKQHVGNVFEIEADTFAAVARAVAKIAAAVQQAVHPAGLNLVQANGMAAGQTVAHLHVHVLPRTEDDGLLINWPRTGETASEQIAAVAARIRAYLPAF